MKKNITRDDIAEAINIEFGLSKKDCLDIVNDIIDSIILGLKQHQIFKIHNFGTFKVRKKESRKARNPKSKVEVIIPPRYVIKFIPSKFILKKINKNINE